MNAVKSSWQVSEDVEVTSTDRQTGEQVTVVLRKGPFAPKNEHQELCVAIAASLGFASAPDPPSEGTDS